MDGSLFDLSKLHGKVVVLNVWATWCTPCRREMPMLDAFYRRYRLDGLVLLGLSADDPGARNEVTRVMRGFSYPAALLSEATSNGFGPPQAVPITYVIGRDGTIQARFMPGRRGLTQQMLEDAVVPLLLPQAR